MTQKIKITCVHIMVPLILITVLVVIGIVATRPLIKQIVMISAPILVILEVISFFDYYRKESLLKKQEEFIAIASHELKTPLTAVVAQIEILKRLNQDERLKKLITDSLRDCQRLGRLIGLLMDSTQAKLNQLSLIISEADLALIIRKTIKDFNYDLQFSGLESLMVNVDPDRIHQVIYNLLNNAIKYGKKQPVKIFLTQHEDRALIEIVDHGIGMDRSQVKQICKPFARVGNLDVPGMGLGLYVTKKIILAHGGDMHISSELGKGTKVSVCLPIKKS